MDTGQRKRAFRSRSKNGCMTCRIRKVRCDEQKPSCQRCVSTGRKCDGYSVDSARRVPSATTTQRQVLSIPRRPQVALPRINAREVRSHNFFVQTTAPTFAGVFDAEFWLNDLPLACLSDPAIWHAVVALGAVHERYNRRSGCGDTAGSMLDSFAVQQFNAAISQLVHQSSIGLQLSVKFRTLTASILFTYICNLQGLRNQSNVHLSAAKNLIRDLKTDTMHRSKPIARPAVSPVSLDSLVSMAASLEISDRTLRNDRVVQKPTPLLGDADTYTAWRYYSTPSSSCGSTLCSHGNSTPPRATPENIARAGRAFESLLNAVIVLSQETAPATVEIMLGNNDKKAHEGLMEALIRQQQPFIRAFRELDVAVRMFKAETQEPCPCLLEGTDLSEVQARNRAIDALLLYHAVCRSALHNLTSSDPIIEGSSSTALPDDSRRVSDPESMIMASKLAGEQRLAQRQHNENDLPGPDDPKNALSRHFAHAIELAESVLKSRLTPSKTGGSGFFAVLSTNLPLLVVAYTGSNLSLRRRAIELLRQYPRRDAMWDSLFVAANAEVVVERELYFAREQSRNLMKDLSVDHTLEPDDDEDVLDTLSIPFPLQVFGTSTKFTGPHSAQVTIQTWGEHIAHQAGLEKDISW